MSRLLRPTLLALALTTVHLPTVCRAGEATSDAAQQTGTAVHHRRVQIEGIELFYREAGSRNAPTLLLLHGFPSSSQMYRDLIPLLADRFHVIAPDYPGFGQSSAPSPSEFEYSFDHFATLIDRFTQELELNEYALYVMDYGAPVGFRLATAHPERVTALVVQNGNAYNEGIGAFWNPIKALWEDNNAANREAIRKAALSLDSTRWHYLHGVPDPTLVSPDAYMLDQAYLDRAGNSEIQLAMIYNYRTNPPKYPEWQAYFRKHRPPTLVIWGKNDQIFLPAGAESYRRDNPDAEVHLLDSGHFALETHTYQIAALIRDFLVRH